MRRALACAVVLLAAACSSSGSAKAKPTTSSVPAVTSAAACAFIDQKDATQLFGRAAATTPDPSTGVGAGSSCLWKATDDDHHTYLIQVRFYNDVAQYSETLPNSEKLAGVGEKAVLRRQAGLGSIEIRWVQGGHSFVVNYVITNVLAKTRHNASDQVDQLIALVKRNFARV